MAQSIPYDGYPQPVGAKREWFGDHLGPGTNAGNYQAGGYNMTASGLGVSSLEFVSFSPLSQSGNYFARANYPVVSGNAESRAPGFAYVIVKWYTAANSVEVANNTNLNAECVQLSARGPG